MEEHPKCGPAARPLYCPPLASAMFPCAFNNRHFDAHLFAANDGSLDKQTSGLHMSQDFNTKGKEILHDFSSFGKEERLKEGVVIGKRFVCNKSKHVIQNQTWGFEKAQNNTDSFFS